jgi:hypothetical protein
MDANTIKSYLISLGFACDSPGLARFNAMLRDSETMAQRAAAGMTKAFVGAGAAVVAAYSSVGTATVAMMDKVAQSEMGYQLLGMKMYMSADAAKSMSIATQALGHSLDEIAWNPQLGKYYGELLRDQGAMQKGLGPDYQKQIREMQDVRFEFSRLQVEGQYAMMGISSAVMRAFGGDNLLDKLKGLNNWIIANLPRWSEMVAKYLVPVLRDGAAVGRDLWHILQDLTSGFLALVGAWYNDDALKTGVVTLDTLGRAAMHLSGSIRHVFDELAAIADWFTRHADLAKFVFGFAGGMVPGIIAGSAIAPGPGTVIGGVTTGLIGGIASVMSDGWSSNGVTPNQAKAMAYEAATRHGLDPAVFMGMIERESSWNPLAKNPHSTASGLGQLLRGTAADMHVGNVFDPYQNLEGSASYLAQLLNQSGNYANALAAYGEGPSYAADILNNRRHHYDSYQPTSGNSSVSFGDTNIYVTQPNASADEIANKTVAKQREMLKQSTQRNIVELSGSYA